ncbi:MAG: BON domain-containing protein [Nitrospirales bacterium]|nr:BON domain-containing protein [Nitrospirales bacterium]MBA3964501.1 BON domain-containing protein [Nitrospirales bacterium]
MHMNMLMAGVTFVAMISMGCASSPLHESTGEYLDDSVITTKVKTALLRCPLVSGTDVHVETFKNRVQLSGFADEMKQIEQAITLTRGVGGVGSVENRISVK